MKSDSLKTKELTERCEKRGRTASMIVASVCNEHKKSDLRANHPDILRAINDQFDEYRIQRETLGYRISDLEINNATLQELLKSEKVKSSPLPDYWNPYKLISRKYYADGFEAGFRGWVIAELVDQCQSKKLQTVVDEGYTAGVRERQRMVSGL